MVKASILSVLILALLSIVSSAPLYDKQRGSAPGHALDNPNRVKDQPRKVKVALLNTFYNYWAPLILNFFVEKVTGETMSGPARTRHQVQAIRQAKLILQHWFFEARAQKHRDGVELKRHIVHMKLVKEGQELAGEKKKIEEETERMRVIHARQDEWKLLAAEIKLRLVAATELKRQAKAEYKALKHQLHAERKQRKKAAKDAHQPPPTKEAKAAQKAADAQALAEKRAAVAEQRAEEARLREEVRRNQVTQFDSHFFESFDMVKEVRRMEKMSDDYHKHMKDDRFALERHWMEEGNGYGDGEFRGPVDGRVVPQTEPTGHEDEGGDEDGDGDVDVDGDTDGD